MERSKLSLREPTHFIATPSANQINDSADTPESKAVQFHERIAELKQTYHYKESDIINMDETPVWFDMPVKQAVDVKGKKQVVMVKQGNNRQKVTVVLACAADGTKLPPVVIAKGSGRRQTQPVMVDGIPVWRQKSGTMTAELMIKWLKFQFSEPEPDTTDGSKRLLIYDSFSGHLTDDVKKQVAASKLHLAVIPGGCTGLCQPLDLTVNRSFKARLRKNMAKTIRRQKPLAPRGQRQKQRLTLLVASVKKAWDKVLPQTITNGFVKGLR